MAYTSSAEARALSEGLLKESRTMPDHGQRSLLEAAANLLKEQAEQIETLRELKDGYYTAMRVWREAKESGRSFAVVQAKYSDAAPETP